jgi:hypothetical protein
VTGAKIKSIVAPLDSLISSVCSTDDDDHGRCKNCSMGYFVTKERLNKPSQATLSDGLPVHMRSQGRGRGSGLTRSRGALQLPPTSILVELQHVLRLYLSLTVCQSLVATSSSSTSSTISPATAMYLS